MIFGTRYADRIVGTKHVFAWFPTLLNDGRWAWLETVQAEYWKDPHANWAGDDSGYRYSAINPNDKSTTGNSQ